MFPWKKQFAGYDPFDVTMFMLWQAEKDGIKMFRIKTAILVYIAHGFSLAVNDRQLINEQFNAAPGYPIHLTIDNYIRIFGCKEIKATPFEPGYIERIDRDIIIEVLGIFGMMNTDELIGRMNKPGSPSSLTKRFSKIDNGIIKNHYKKIIKLNDFDCL